MMKRTTKLGVGMFAVGTTVSVLTWKFYREDKKYNQALSKQINKEKAKKVAVIGAGVSGIVTTKWLLEEGHQVKTFEQSGGIGGNWQYVPLQAGDENEISSSCYKNLKCITTSNSMSFEGFPMPKRYGVFPSHFHIHKYLTDYCNAFNLWPSLVFNAKVTSVIPVDTGGYSVTVSRNGAVTSEMFDAVAVCNGHNANPYWPPELVKDLEHFTGEVIHSRSYRTPNYFSGKKVLVLGGGVSGKQIALDVSYKADLAAISTRRPINLAAIYKGKPGRLRMAKFTNSLVQVAPPLSANPFVGKEVQFEDGSKKSFDAIIVCSGYRSNFPFLEKNLVDSIVKFPENCSHPPYMWLYKHTFPIPESEEDDFPTLAFIGMMDVTDASLFSMADTQAKWFALLLSRKTQLPARAQMYAETQEWLHGVDLRYHPMAVRDPRTYCAQVRAMIEKNRVKE